MIETLPKNKDYEKDVFDVLMKQGSKLRNTITTQDDTKPPLVSRRVGHWCDDHPNFLTDREHRLLALDESAACIGRQADSFIVNALSDTSLDCRTFTDGISKKTFSDLLLASLGSPRIMLVGWKQWGELLNIPEFAILNCLEGTDLPFPEMTARRWHNILIIAHSGLVIKEGERKCLFYNKTAISNSIASEIEVDINYEQDYRQHFIQIKYLQKTKILCEKDIIQIPCLEKKE